ncbi:MAG: HAD-IC family P-type ATPase [Actinomycetota bacterium]|nr:HAD-IC family P-type ATPase [Actinomycetota bacterium]
MTDPHARDGEEIAGELSVDPERGLSSGDVERRRRAVGPNTVRPRRTRQWWRILWSQIKSAVVVLLAAAGLVGLAVGHVEEAAAIGVVLVANTVVGFLTEYQAARSIASLREMMRTIAEVERDDRRDEIDARELVPGDIVTVEAGERVPADVRLLETEDLTVDESAITGESEPVTKGVAAVAADAPLAERTCMLFMGTTARAGRGRGVVVSTGRATHMGRVAELAEAADQPPVPLQAGLARLSRRLALTVVIGAGALAGIGVLRGRPPTEVAEVAIALAIAVVPEGLPAVATLTLAVGMRRMARRHALVRNLPAVETLGSTTVVCSDKTGTLTVNRMDVAEVVTADGADERRLWETAVLCNDADIDPDGDPVGDPTEVALLTGASSADLDWRRLRDDRPRQREVPFDSETMRMATINDGTVHVKGAAEAILDPVQHRQLADAAQRMAEDAMRTLAFARRDAPDRDAADSALFEGLDALGVVGLRDPPRDAAVETVDRFHRAGIRVVMITGDQPEMARALADQLQLASHQVITGPQLDDADDDDLVALVGEVDVFARVDAEHKLRIIRALQGRGEVVAVTGDGVNDAPALSQADVGVSMGSGTDVAHEASDMVLTDDDFNTIESAVEEGRRIFTNIRRFGQFLFSWHVAEVTVVSAALLAGLDPPLVGLMILWNNLIIDVLPSFALALEPRGAEVMRQPPRPPGEPVMTRDVVRRLVAHGLLVAAVGLAGYAVGLWGLRLEVAGAQTLTFVTLTAAQVLAVFNARSEHGLGFAGAGRNVWLWAALAATIALEAAALGVPPLRDLLGLTVLPPAAWLVAALLAPVPLLVVQAWRVARHARNSKT